MLYLEINLFFHYFYTWPLNTINNCFRRSELWLSNSFCLSVVCMRPLGLKFTQTQDSLRICKCRSLWKYHLWLRCIYRINILSNQILFIFHYFYTWPLKTINNCFRPSVSWFSNSCCLSVVWMRPLGLKLDRNSGLTSHM